MRSHGHATPPKCRRALVSPFRSSHHSAAPLVANFGIEGHEQHIDLVWLWFRSPHFGLTARMMRISEIATLPVGFKNTFQIHVVAVRDRCMKGCSMKSAIFVLAAILALGSS